MDRKEISRYVMNPAQFPFWVPVITHYQVDGSVDHDRMLSHARQIRPYTRLWMVAGTTGDGWLHSLSQYRQLVEYGCAVASQSPQPTLLVGALQPDTRSVIERIEVVKDCLGIARDATLQENLPLLKRWGFAGVTICPPVGEQVTQDQIEEHISQVCQVSALPIVVYQLPQVTRNLIAPQTLFRLVQRFPQIILFKDSGGGDEIARSGQMPDSLVLVRGAEGNYFEVLKNAGGWYDGWLLSTGNAFAPQLAQIQTCYQQGDYGSAAQISQALSNVVQRVFALAQDLPNGNPFSNANRAVDHLLAYGKSWQDHPLPVLLDGSRLPADFIARVETLITAFPLVFDHGYLQRS